MQTPFGPNKPGLVLVHVPHRAPRLLSGVELPGVTWHKLVHNTSLSPCSSTLTLVLNRNSNLESIRNGFNVHAGNHRARARRKGENSLNETLKNQRKQTNKNHLQEASLLPGHPSYRPKRWWTFRLTPGVSVDAQTAVYEERVIRRGGHSEHGAAQRAAGSGEVAGEGSRGHGGDRNGEIEEVGKGRFTFESRSRSPGPGRTYPAVRLPASNNLHVIEKKTHFHNLLLETASLGSPKTKSASVTVQFPPKSLNPRLGSQQEKDVETRNHSLAIFEQRANSSPGWVDSPRRR